MRVSRSFTLAGESDGRGRLRHRGRRRLISFVVVGASALALTMPRHALLFRHCVRSTSSSIKHGLASFEQASDYMGIPPPEWGVPEHWCTTTGLEMMSGTGRDLRRVLGDDVTQLSVVSDTVMRDVDTSGALMAGFCRERLPDCATLRLDPLLFEASRSPELDLPPLCDRSGWDDEQQAAEVRRRLASVPRPAPVAEALATLQELYGVGAAGNRSHALCLMTQRMSVPENEWSILPNQTCP